MGSSFVYLNDVTTTPDDPPTYLVANDTPYPPQNEAIQLQKYGTDFLYPHKYTNSAEEVFNIIINMIESEDVRNWALIKTVDEDEKLIEFTETTKMMKFVDDVIVKIVGDNNGCVLHMRSKSRIGKGDLDANNKRVEYFLSKLDENENITKREKDESDENERFPVKADFHSNPSVTPESSSRMGELSLEKERSFSSTTSRSTLLMVSKSEDCSSLCALLHLKLQNQVSQGPPHLTTPARSQTQFPGTSHSATSNSLRSSS